MSATPTNPSRIQIIDLKKTYGNEPVLNNLNLSFQPGHKYCLMAPSGAGKTTLFRILMGLEQADSGQILGLENRRMAAVFQEDRLLEGYTAAENIRFVIGNLYSANELNTILLRILPNEALTKPVCEFSGGMKRRVAILRTVLTPTDFLIMDEPFTGLDMDTKMVVIDLIQEYTKGKTLLVATHGPEDAKLLDAEVIHLET